MLVNKVLSSAIAAALLFSAIPATATFAQEYRDRGYHRDYDRKDYNRGRCSPREAHRQARARGMYNTRIYSIDKKEIIVEGYGKRDEYTRLALANRRGCARIK